MQRRIAATSAIALVLGGIASLASLDDMGPMPGAAVALDGDTATAPQDGDSAAPVDNGINAPPPLPMSTLSQGPDGSTRSGAQPDTAARSGTRTAANTDPVERRRVNIEAGDTLVQVLMNAAVPADNAQDAVDALDGVYDVRRLKAGQTVTVLFNHEQGGEQGGRFIGMEFQPAAEKSVTVALDGSGFQAKQIDKPLTKRLVAAHGRISSSLSEAASAAGVPYPVLDAFIKRYAYDVDFAHDLQPGDSFEILYERYFTEDGKPAREGDLLFAELTLSGKEKAIYRYQAADGQVDYYSPTGESTRRAILRTPVDGARVTSGYGMRMHPLLGYSKMHKGKDFGAPIGTPIYAASDGVIEQMGPFSSYGNYVRLRHGNQMETAYGHMSRFAKGLHAGMRVSQGEVIGYVGATGRATGPHLHFEILRGGQQINPDSKEAKMESGRKLDGKDLRQFQAAVQQTAEAFRNTPEGSSTLVNAQIGLGRIVNAKLNQRGK